MLNNYIIPVIILIIIFYGYNKCNLYDTFLEGCIDGLGIVVKIIPTIVAMLLAINIFINCGIFKIINAGKYSEILTMCFLRPISGNATLAMLSNIYRQYGVDSFIGRLGSVIQGSTDTTIYVLALYFSSVGIKHERYALIVGLFADVCGLIAAFLVVNFLF